MVRYTKEFLEPLVKESESRNQVLKKLGLLRNGNNSNMIRRCIEEYNIDTSHFKLHKIDVNTYVKYDLKDLLVEKSNITSSKLKDKLYKEGLKERKCVLCGQDENWRGKHMSLILDHINGVSDDNRLENLRIVCPNCNATLETHCRGANKLLQMEETKKLNFEKTHKVCECGNYMSKKAKLCLKCFNINKSNIAGKPSLAQLKLDIEELGYKGSGRKYGVSDNAIRKWLKILTEINEINKTDVVIHNDIEKYKIKITRKTQNYFTENRKNMFYNNRKIKNRPSLEELEKNIEEFGCNYVSNLYNVNKSTIFRWIQSYKNGDYNKIYCGIDWRVTSVVS
jgi:hypothetical protein